MSKWPDLRCSGLSGSDGPSPGRGDRPCSGSPDSLWGGAKPPFVLLTGNRPELKSAAQRSFTETVPGPSRALSPGFGGAYSRITIIRDQLSVKLRDTKQVFKENHRCGLESSENISRRLQDFGGKGERRPEVSDADGMCLGRKDTAECETEKMVFLSGQGEMGSFLKLLSI